MKLTRRRLKRLIESILKEDDMFATGRPNSYGTGKHAENQMRIEEILEVPEFARLVKFYEDFGEELVDAIFKIGDSPYELAMAFHESTMGMGTDEAKMAAVLILSNLRGNNRISSFESEYVSIAKSGASLALDDYGSGREAIEKETSGNTQSFLLDLYDQNIVIAEVDVRKSYAKNRYGSDKPMIYVTKPGWTSAVTGQSGFPLFHEGNVFGIDQVSLGEDGAGKPESSYF